MTAALFFAFALHASAAPPAVIPAHDKSGQETRAQATRACMSAAEARAVIARHRLVDPMGALRAAARQGQAEPLRSRLCRWNDKFVYEMALLRRDGRVIRVFLDARDGSPIGR